MELYEKEVDEDYRTHLRKLRGAYDLEFYAESYFPHYCLFPFNPFHRAFFSKVQFGERAQRRAWAAPRGAAKSTHAALIKPIHDVCYGLEEFIILISNRSDLAAAKLKDIRNEVLTNLDLQRDFGIHFPRKNPGESHFILHTDDHSTLFMAFGRGSQIRGVRHGAARPSKIIVDDSEHSEEVYNEEIRQKTEHWFFEDVGKVGDTQTNIEFVGTVLHRESLLKKLLKNPAYDGETFKSVISWSTEPELWAKWQELYINLDDPNRMANAQAFYKANEEAMLRGTEVLWPEKEPYEYLMRELIEIGRRSFFKEKQNDPIGSDEKVFHTIHWYKEVDTGLHILNTGVIIPWDRLKHNAFGVIDPATGKNKAGKGKLGDFAVIATGFTDDKKRLFVHKDWTKRATPSVYIKEIFEHHEKWTYNKFGVETNLYRELLLPNIMDEKKRREAEKKTLIKLPFYDIEQTENKTERITRLEPKMSHGYILLNVALSDEFKNQVEDFPKADHDDCPDALEMLWGLCNNRYQAAGTSLNAMGGR